MDLKKLCQKYFNTTNLYEVLNIKNTASEKDVKKAYYKLSLKVHPDRVHEDDKEMATEKFKVLGKVHQILTDPNKRNSYNYNGFICDEGDQSTMNWSLYWSIINMEISKEDIQNYEKNYKGSNIELEDFKRAYTDHKGDMDKIIDAVPFSSCDDELRFKEIAKKFIESEEAIHYEIFFNEPRSKYNRRHTKHKRRMAKAASEELNKSKITTKERGSDESIEKIYNDFVTKCVPSDSCKKNRQLNAANSSSSFNKTKRKKLSDVCSNGT